VRKALDGNLCRSGLAQSAWVPAVLLAAEEMAAG